MGSFEAFYNSEWQELHLLLVFPALFLGYRALAPRPRSEGAEPAAAGFVSTYALVFAVETLLDPLVGGPLLRWLGPEHTAVAAATGFAFVWLGDFRVLLLVAYLADRRRALGMSIALATLVPILAGGLYLTLDESPVRVLWLIHETIFLALALLLRARLVPAHREGAVRRYVRAVLAYVAVYYGLWAVADVLILSGLDLGWALRVVPNQLYYGLYVPFAYFRFFARSGEAPIADEESAGASA